MRGSQRLRRDVDRVQATTAGPVYMGWGTDLWAPSQKLIENVAVLNQRLGATAFSPGDRRTSFSAPRRHTTEIPELSGEIPSSWANLTTSLSRPLAAGDRRHRYSAKRREVRRHQLRAGLRPVPGRGIRLAVERRAEVDGPQQRRPGRRSRETNASSAMRRRSLCAPARFCATRCGTSPSACSTRFPASTPIVVFNPLGWTRDDLVKTHVTLFGDIESERYCGLQKGHAPAG